MDSKSVNNINIIDLENQTNLFGNERKSSVAKPTTHFIRNTLEKNRRKEIRIRLFNHKFHHQNHVKIEDDQFSNVMPINQIEVKTNSSFINYIPCCNMQ